MYFRRQSARLRRAIDEYPRAFWILVGATFIDSLGGFMLFPFFALYITQKFGVGMTEVGILFGLFSLTDLLGSLIGGALTDRLGRKTMTLFGLVASATVVVVLGLVNTIELFGLAALTVGIFSSIGGPARQAMVADILPESQRAEGYGIMRVGFNLSASVAPAIGGLLAASSYLYLFVTDAALSLLTAVIVFLLLPETRPRLRRMGQEPPESMAQTFRGYGVALRDGLFVAFCVVSILLAIVMLQFNTTLGVFLRDVHGVSPQYYGYILSMNAVMVVLFQFSVTRRIKVVPQFMAMAFGTVLYAVGFGLYGFVSAYPMFLFAMAIITVGEMVVAPVSQAIAARMAPEEMRGRYMAVFGFTWVIPGMIGPLLAGLVLDNLDPRWLWYLVALVGFVAAAGFVTLERAQTQRERGALAARQAGA